MSILLAVIAFILLFMAVKLVPEQEIWVLQRLGRFHKKLSSGLHIIFPFIDLVAYKHSLMEKAMDISSRNIITKDNASVELEGMVYIKILDPIAASYKVVNLRYAIDQLAQTITQVEVGKVHLDKLFKDRENLNKNIMDAINKASLNWGIKCIRYAIKDITLSEAVRKAMDLEVATEKQNYIKILESEGYKQSQINHGEAHKQELILSSDASYADQTNRSRGEAESILKIAEASAKAIEKIAETMKLQGANKEAALDIAQRKVEAIMKLVSENNARIKQPETADICGIIEKALGALDIFKALKPEPKKPAVEEKKSS